MGEQRGCSTAWVSQATELELDEGLKCVRIEVELSLSE
jgi:hypothetical protein